MLNIPRGTRKTAHRTPFRFATLVLFALTMITGCTAQPADSRTAIPAVTELTIYNWVDALPASIIQRFTDQTGIQINYQTFISYEEAVEHLQAGDVYDLVWIGTVNTGDLINAGLLAKLDRRNVPNMRNISANFRNLVYDPENTYSVTYTWGTTGILMRGDLVTQPIKRWSDLWDTQFQPVGIWDDMRTTMGFTLKSMGYSVNSEHPDELENVRQRLAALKTRAVFLEDYDLDTSAYALADGKLSVAVGWTYDVLTGNPLNSAIQYVIPEEGTILWGECLVIPASSPHKAAAEQLMNFLLSPEISAMYTNETSYATTIDAAKPLIDPTLLQNEAVFPTPELLKNAEILLPLSSDGLARYNEIWSEFMAS